MKISEIMVTVLKNVFHIENAKEYVEKLFQFVKFGIVGLSNTVISYVVYLLFYSLGVNYIVASALGFLISVINSFFWNNKYVFKKENSEKRNLLNVFLKTFAAYAGTGLILSNILLIIWVEVLGIPKTIAPIISLLITIPLNFILNKFWAFNEK